MHPHALHCNVQEGSAVSDAEVGSFVFNDLATANDASSSSISSIQPLGRLTGLGIMRGSTFGQSVACNTVCCYFQACNKVVQPGQPQTLVQKVCAVCFDRLSE